jgi:hypothetical protein
MRITELDRCGEGLTRGVPPIKTMLPVAQLRTVASLRALPEPAPQSLDVRATTTLSRMRTGSGYVDWAGHGDPSVTLGTSMAAAAEGCPIDRVGRNSRRGILVFQTGFEAVQG